MQVHPFPKGGLDSVLCLLKVLTVEQSVTKATLYVHPGKENGAVLVLGNLENDSLGRSLPTNLEGGLRRTL